MAANERQELEELRRIDELEKKASGKKPETKQEPIGAGEAMYTGAKTAIMEPIYGAGELVPGEFGKGAASRAKELEQEYKRTVAQQPIATRLGYFPTTAATLAIPGTAGVKLAEGAPLLARALAGGGLAGFTGGVLAPTGEEDYTKRLKEKGTGAALGTALGTTLGAAVPLAPAAGKAITKGYEALTGKAAKQAEQQAQATKGSIKQAAEAGKTDIEKRAEELGKSEFEKRARQESNLKGAEKKFMTDAEKERQSAAMKFADLKAPDPRITDTATLGDAMQRSITRAESTVGSRRSQQASRVYGAYFEEAKGFEKSKPREFMLQKLKALSESSPAGSAEREAASKAYSDLSASQDAVGAEKEFRKYFEGASGPQQPGYGAIQQEASKKVSDIIGDALNTHAPKRIEARKEYAEFSTPLDAFETFFGKKGVKEEANVAGRIQMQPTDYPATYFKNRDTVRALREQLRGDEAAVRKFANAHAVNELEGLDGKQAASWLDKNSSWVNEVPGLNDRVNKYVQELSRSEEAAAMKESQARKLGAKKEEVIKTGQATEQEIKDSAVSQKKEIDDMLLKLNTLDPEKSAGAAKSMIDKLSTMRDVNGKTIVDPSTLSELHRSMKMVDDAYGKSAKASELKRSLIYKTLGAVGLGGAGLYSLGKYLGD